MRTNPLLRAGLLALLVAGPAGALPVRQISLPANDLVYDPVQKLIYASVPGAAGSIGNSLTAIDPETGQVGASVVVGSEPGKLAISDQGRTIYVSLDGAAAVRRFDTVTGTAGLQFSLGSGYGPNFADDLAVVPGHPDLVAISLYNKGISPNGVGVFVFENGVPRPKFVKGVNALAYSNDPSRLYGYDNQSTGFGFLRMKADDTGIPGGDWLLLMTGFGVHILYDGGRIYATNGGVYDPEAGRLLGTLPGGVIRPDAALGRVFLLRGQGANVQLQAFDANSFALVWSAHIADVTGGVGSLIRWGADGLAFRTGGGQVFLLHTGELSSAPPEFTLTLNPATAAGEATVLGTITLPTTAPPAGLTVLLSSSDPAAAATPPQVIVAPGSTTAAFPVLTHAVTAAEDVVISAVAGGTTGTATLHLVSSSPPPPPAGPVFNPANSHWYQAVPAPGGITWANARAAAAAMSYAGYPGHLVTITSADENQFLVRNLPLSLDDHWRVGGYQDHTAPDYIEPGGGWRWITGEPWGYTNWRGGEPNNAGGEDLLEIHSDGTWNDTADQPPGGGYIIEFEPYTPPTPPALPAPVYDPANGHWYQEIRLPNPITWPEAKAAAEKLSYAGLQGHLATVTSEEENRFVSHYMTTLGPLGDIWIGGYQDHSAPDYREPAGGWHWVTGEPWSYTSWSPGEPNNASSVEDALETNSGGTWNDLPTYSGVAAYLVEYEPLAPLPPSPDFTVTVNPIAAIGEATVTGTITLAAPTPSGGITFQLSSDHPAVVTVPPTVTAAAGATTAIFPITAHTVAVRTDVRITATAGGIARVVTLHLAPPPAPPPVSGPTTPVYNPVNGHWYQVVRVPSGIDWPTARAAAQTLAYAGLPGHLATLTSADEVRFVSSSVLSSTGDREHFWLGAYQDRNAPDYREPAGGWRWVTGEAFSYANWIPGEPSNSSGDEDVVELARERGDQWNDLPDWAALGGYLIEYEPLAPLPPSPNGAALLLFPNPVPGGLLALGQMALPQAAGPGGLVVSLNSSNPATAVVPANVTVVAGASAATFPIVTFAVSQPTAVTLTAGGSFGTATATLQVLPLGSPTPPPTATNLLVNGSFEDPPVPAGQVYATFGSGGIPGWRVLKGTVDLDQDWQQAPGQGRQSLGLVGTPGAGTVEQSFATEPGREYIFSGWISHDYGLGTPEGRADVYLNGAFFVQLFHNAPTSQTDMQWTSFSYPFRATTAMTTLRMTDVTDISSYQGLVLDGLSVTLAADQSPPVVTPAADLPAPTGLTVQPVSNQGVQLLWQDNSPDENAFAIWRKTPGGEWTRIGVLAPNTTRFLDPSAAPGMSYTYRVRATRANTASAWSNEVSIGLAGG